MTPNFVECPDEACEDSGELFVAQTPTTNRQFAEFVRLTGRPAPGYWRGNEPPEILAEHPVVDVTWETAREYCRWLAESTGLPVRLPTAAEWEWAAGGPKDLLFPWGHSFEPGRANTVEAGIGTTTPVDAFPAGTGPFGALDQAGNVWEWCADLDDSGWTVLKGGSYLDTEWGVCLPRRLSAYPVRATPNVGFRPVYRSE